MCVKGDERLAWLRFACVQEFPVSLLLALLQELQLPETVFEVPQRLLVKSVGEKWARELQSHDVLDKAKECERWLDKTPNAGIVTITDPDYPRLLLQAGVAPAVLFYRGNRSLMSRPSLGIVGTQAPDREGTDNAWNFAKAIGSRGISVATTLNAGVAQWAAQSALKAGVGTIGVAPCGIDRCFPTAQKTLYQQVSKEGLVISAFAPGREFTEDNARNQAELLVGLVGGILVVQSQPHDVNARIAKLAGEWGRDVFVIPGSIHSPQYKGNHRLIRQGATLVESVDDLLER